MLLKKTQRGKKFLAVGIAGSVPTSASLCVARGEGILMMCIVRKRTHEPYANTPHICNTSLKLQLHEHIPAVRRLRIPEGTVVVEADAEIILPVFDADVGEEGRHVLAGGGAVA